MPFPEHYSREEKLALAIYEALEKEDDGAFLGVFKVDRAITVDGSFDLVNVAKSLLEKFEVQEK